MFKTNEVEDFTGQTNDLTDEHIHPKKYGTIGHVYQTDLRMLFSSNLWVCLKLTYSMYTHSTEVLHTTRRTWSVYHYTSFTS